MSQHYTPPPPPASPAPIDPHGCWDIWDYLSQVPLIHRVLWRCPLVDDGCLYTRRQLGRLLGVDGRQLRRWRLDGMESLDDGKFFYGRNVLEYFARRRKEADRHAL